MKIECIIVILALFASCFAETPAQIGPPKISAVSSTTISIIFSPTNVSNTFVISVEPRHRTNSITFNIIGQNSTIITNLTESTLYDISVREENADGEISIPGNITSAQTHPGAPTLSFSTPTTKSVLVFFNTANRARVSQWFVEYHDLSTNETRSLTTPDRQYYSLWLTGLQPNTVYQIRARCSQIHQNGKTVQLNDTSFSEPKNITTDSLSVFGTVSLVNPTSTDKNNITKLLKKAYEDLNISFTSLSILDFENAALPVYYRLKIKDKNRTQTSDDSYLLLDDTQFRSSVVNNGNTSSDTGFLSVTGNRWDLLYVRHSDVTLKAAMYMLISPEGIETQAIDTLKDNDTERQMNDHLSTSFSLNITSGNYLLGTSSSSLEQSLKSSKNAVIGMEPKFLVRDLCANNISNLCYAEYEPDDIQSSSRDRRSLRTTDMPAPDMSTTTYFSSLDDSSVILYLPNIDKSIAYEINGPEISNATITESDIDGSQRLKINLGSLRQGETYALNMKVTQRKHDGSTSFVIADFNLTARNCSKCLPDSTCEISMDGTISCPATPTATTSTTLNTITQESTHIDSTPFTTISTIPNTPTTVSTTIKPKLPTTNPTIPPSTIHIDSTSFTTISAARDATTMVSITTGLTTSTSEPIPPPITMTPTTPEPTTSTSTTGEPASTVISTMPDATTTSESTISAETSTALDPTTPLPSTSHPPTSTIPDPTTTLGCVVESAINKSFIPSRVDSSFEYFNISWNDVFPVDGYSISVECVDCEEEHKFVLRANASFISINNVLPGRFYNICVEASLCNRGSLLSRTQCKGFRINPSPVTNATYSITGPTSVNISWDPVFGASTYIASLEILPSPRVIIEQTLDTSGRPFAEFSNLERCTKYTAKIVASNSGGSSKPTRFEFATDCPTTAITTTSTAITKTTTVMLPTTAATTFASTISPSSSITSFASATTVILSSSSKTDKSTDITSHTTDIPSATPTPTETTDITTSMTESDLNTTISISTSFLLSILSSSATGLRTETSAPGDSISIASPGPDTEGVPWWFILAMVLAGLICVIATIFTIKWCCQTRRSWNVRTSV